MCLIGGCGGGGCSCCWVLFNPKSLQNTNMLPLSIKSREVDNSNPWGWLDKAIEWGEGAFLHSREGERAGALQDGWEALLISSKFGALSKC